MAAALRIGRLCRNLMNNNLRKTIVEYDPNGSLVTTHDGHGSDMGLYGGVLGWEADDERLKNFKEELSLAGQEVEIRYVSYNAQHPNTYKLTLESDLETREMTAISTGGGMIEVQEVDHIPLTMLGDFHETLVWVPDASGLDKIQSILGATQVEFMELRNTSEKTVIQIKTVQALPQNIIQEFSELFLDVRIFQPVMPVLSRREVSVPFIDPEAMQIFNEDKNLDLAELSIAYEQQRSGLPREEVIMKMTNIVRVMRSAVDSGLKGTEYKDRILPCQSVNFVKSMNAGMLLQGDVINSIISYVSAIMEVKSSMGVFVAAPTAGSCGACPGTVLAVSDALNKSEEDTVKAMFIAGMIGAFVQHKATFSAEVGGCMAECGTGSGMASAAIVYMAGGTLDQSLAACSMAIQNSFGMTCDPIANRVEAPCLGKNIMAATNAFSCANMSLAGYKHLIPLGEVLDAMNQVAGMIPHELRCTGKAGLATTPTAMRIEEGLGGATIASRLGCGGKVPC